MFVLRNELHNITTTNINRFDASKSTISSVQAYFCHVLKIVDQVLIPACVIKTPLRYLDNHL